MIVMIRSERNRAFIQDMTDTIFVLLSQIVNHTNTLNLPSVFILQLSIFVYDASKLFLNARRLYNSSFSDKEWLREMFPQLIHR